MKKNLVIVESPAKAKTITKYLNGNKALTQQYGTFLVMASYGHVRDLEKKALGIDIDKGFVPSYRVTDEKTKTVADLKTKAAESQMVWLASDFDREGEGIAMHLKEVLKLKKYKRITFTEITPKALEAAILNPRDIDNDLVDSQETRRILDRIVGFKLSPMLWKKYKTENMSGLSAGRVQSAVVHLIMQREHDIRNFQSESYWYLVGDMLLKLKQDKIPLEVKLYSGATMYKETDPRKVKGLLSKMKGDFSVKEVKTRDSKKSADLPFITSTLQQEAYSKHGFTLKRSMQLAQELYEKGHITYMRTDSYNVSDDFKTAAQGYVATTFGTEYWSGGSSKSKKKQKNAQEAHEAIRPTHVNVKAEDLQDLSADHRKLYDMIWKRTVAYFMVPCVHMELDIKIQDGSFNPSDMYFLASFSRVKFNGYMAVYGVQNEDLSVLAAYVDALKDPKKHSIQGKTITAKNTWNSPPQRFSESSIIKALESEGIGRPSTYASIMTKLFDKKYIVKTDMAGVEKPTINFVYDMKRVTEEKGTVTLGSERSKLVPTSIGEEIDSFLEQHFAYIVDKGFTSNMEADLDRIADGSKTKLDVLNTFWKVFKQDLAKQEAVKEKKVVLKTESAELVVDGKPYIIRHAKYGPVIEMEVPGQAKKGFINLKPYLKLFKKDIMDVVEDDVRLLVGMPRKLCVIDKKEFVFTYGPYGFYGKYQDRNIRLPYKTVSSILKELAENPKTFVCTPELVKALKSSIEYNEKKAAAPKEP